MIVLVCVNDNMCVWLCVCYYFYYYLKNNNNKFYLICFWFFERFLYSSIVVLCFVCLCFVRFPFKCFLSNSKFVNSDFSVLMKHCISCIWHLWWVQGSLQMFWGFMHLHVWFVQWPLEKKYTYTCKSA